MSQNVTKSTLQTQNVTFSNSINLPHRCVVFFPWFLSSTGGFNVISSLFSSHPTSHTKREERLNSGSRGGSFEGAINRRRHSPAVAKTRRTLSYKVALSIERHFEAITPFPNARGYIFHRKAHPFKFPNRRGEFFEVTRSSEYELSSPAGEQKYAMLGLGWSNGTVQCSCVGGTWKGILH